MFHNGGFERLGEHEELIDAAQLALIDRVGLQNDLQSQMGDAKGS